MRKKISIHYTEKQEIRYWATQIFNIKEYNNTQMHHSSLALIGTNTLRKHGEVGKRWRYKRGN